MRKHGETAIAMVVSTINYPRVEYIFRNACMQLNLPKICSLDYFDYCLFIPEWDGDMITLEKTK